ncbi:MAG: hypothetical protein ABIP55_08765, partial [Tepidisphaeraceae bacterium]
VDQNDEVEKYQRILSADLLSSESPFSTGQPITLRQALDLANRQNERLAIEGENYLQALIDRAPAGGGDEERGENASASNDGHEEFPRRKHRRV